MISIPFTPQMVRAILAGRKTQTRRFPSKRTGKPDLRIGSTPYVREAWRVPARFDPLRPTEIDFNEALVHYEADGPAPDGYGRLRPGMFMPGRASRITLRIVGVRIERLQDITVTDATAEGCRYNSKGQEAGFWTVGLGATCTGSDAIECYANLWSLIHGAGSWDANPIVVVYDFRQEMRR